MMGSAYAFRLRMTLASVTTDHGTELDAALDVFGLITLKGKVVIAAALHCNRRTVVAISSQGRLVPCAEGQAGLAPVRSPRLCWQGEGPASGGPPQRDRSPAKEIALC